MCSNSCSCSVYFCHGAIDYPPQQVALEGRISQQSVVSALAQGEKPAGDLIPWVVSNQYQDETFPQMSGARIVRIATHPALQGVGLGRHMLVGRSVLRM